MVVLMLNNTCANTIVFLIMCLKVLIHIFYPDGRFSFHIFPNTRYAQAPLIEFPRLAIFIQYNRVYEFFFEVVEFFLFFFIFLVLSIRRSIYNKKTNR